MKESPAVERGLIAWATGQFYYETHFPSPGDAISSVAKLTGRPVKRKSLEDSPCAIARALDTIGDWWTLLIMRDAFEGITRFNEFQKSLAIPKNILSVRLKCLVTRDILEVQPASDGSNYQEYVLTDLGKDLFHVMVALRQWGERHLFAEGEGPVATLVDRARGRPVATLRLPSDDGKTLELADTLVAYSR